MMRDPVARQKAWEAMRFAGVQGFSISQIQHLCGGDYHHCQRYIAQLRKVAYVEMVSGDRGKEGESVFALVRDTGAIAPNFRGGFHDPNLAGSIKGGRQRVWIAVRIVKQFRLQELATLAQLSEDFTRRYLSQLAGAGYVSLSKGTYVLLRDTGSIAPIPSTDGIYDPNFAQQKRLLGGQS